LTPFARTLLLQPRARGASLEGLLLHGLQGGLGSIDLLLGLLEGLRQLQYRMPLTPHEVGFSVSNGSELAQEITPLHVRLLLPLTYRCHTLLPVGRIVPCLVEDNLSWFWRQSILGLQLLQGLFQGIEPLLYGEQSMS
jgi:hypothetical protein